MAGGWLTLGYVTVNSLRGKISSVIEFCDETQYVPTLEIIML